MERPAPSRLTYILHSIHTAGEGPNEVPGAVLLQLMSILSCRVSTVLKHYTNVSTWCIPWTSFSFTPEFPGSLPWRMPSPVKSALDMLRGRGTGPAVEYAVGARSAAWHVRFAGAVGRQMMMMIMMEQDIFRTPDVLFIVAVLHVLCRHCRRMKSHAFLRD